MSILTLFVCAVFAANSVTGSTEVGRTRRDAGVITKKLRIVAISAVPYTNICDSDTGLRFEGFIPDLIYELSKRLHFDYEFYEVPDGRYGSQQEDGSWDGMIGELLLNQHDPDGNVSTTNDPERPGADMVAAPLAVTSKRQHVVNYLHPFHNLGFTILVKKSDLMDNGTDVWPFHFSILMPFSAAVWGMIFLSGIVIAGLLCLLNYFNPYEWGGRFNLGLADVHQKDSFSLSGAFWFVFSTLQWQGFELAPRAVSSKLLTCFWFAFVTTTLATYIGGLINQLWWSSMAFRYNPSGHPITDLEDLVAGAGVGYKYGTIRNRTAYNYVTEVAKHKVEFQMMKNYWKTEDGQAQLVDRLEEAIEKIRTEKYAFIVETMVARWQVNQKPCDLSTVGKQFGMISYGLAVPRYWPYYDVFHRSMMELTEEGVIEELEMKWWEGRGECWDVHSSEKVLRQANAIYLQQAKPRVIDLHMFWGHLVLMVLGVVISVIVAIVEILYYRYRGKYLSSNRPRDQSLKLENEDGNI